LWLLVLFFSALSFSGYLARRIVGASRGYPVAGLLGGMVSSTSVTLSFARFSRDHDGLGQPLAQGVVAANTVLYVRVIVAAAVLSPTLALTLVPHLAAPFAIGTVAAAWGFWTSQSSDEALDLPRNPLQLRGALEMALLFQIVLFVVHVAGRQLGSSGVLVTAAVLGLNDADALTLSMAKSVGTGLLTLDVAAKAVTVGLLSNTCVKLGLAAAIGEGPFRTLTVSVLAMMAAALGLGVWLL
ncbi:MAG: MgtC/SapB family protein, partial [Vicinamibacterales bacterium]